MAVLGFPDGSLSKRILDLLLEAGVEIPFLDFLEKRIYLLTLPLSEFNPFDQFLVVRPQDTPKFVWEGVINVGFSGMDWFRESGLTDYLEVLAAFNFSKAQLVAPKLVVLAKPGRKFEDTKRIIVTTEYPILATEWFKKARIISVRGKAESAVLVNFADFCVDLYDQGRTAKVNGLVVVDAEKRASYAPAILLIRKDSSLLPAAKIFAGKLQEAFTRLTKK